MAQEIESQVYDIKKDRDLRPNTVKVAKNPNKPGGWQICESKKHTNNQPGLLLPVIVDVPVDPQFQTVVKYAKDHPDPPGKDGEPKFGQRTQVLDIYEAKGFIKAKDAYNKRPPQWVAELLIENHLRELETDMRAQRYDSDKIDERVQKRREYLYHVNGFEPPEHSPIDAAADRYGVRAEELMEANREEAEDKGVAETPKGERGKGKGKN